MEQNYWIDSQVPGATRARRALQLVVKPARRAPDSDGDVDTPLSGRPIKDVLVVDPSLELQRTVRNVVGWSATVHSCSTFEDAHSRLLCAPPDLLVTSVRLQAHNGLHLVYVASCNRRTRCIVHLTEENFDLARDAERAGAFVVRSDLWLEVAIWSLVFGHAAMGTMTAEK